MQWHLWKQFLFLFQYTLITNYFLFFLVAFLIDITKINSSLAAVIIIVPCLWWSVEQKLVGLLGFFSIIAASITWCKLSVLVLTRRTMLLKFFLRFYRKKKNKIFRKIEKELERMSELNNYRLWYSSRYWIYV